MRVPKEWKGWRAIAVMCSGFSPSLSLSLIANCSLEKIESTNWMHNRFRSYILFVYCVYKNLSFSPNQCVSVAPVLFLPIDYYHSAFALTQQIFKPCTSAGLRFSWTLGKHRWTLLSLLIFFFSITEMLMSPGTEGLSWACRGLSFLYIPCIFLDWALRRFTRVRPCALAFILYIRITREKW